jgi:hypothetical protein
MYKNQICPVTVSTDSHYETHQQQSSTCSFRDEKKCTDIQRHPSRYEVQHFNKEYIKTHHSLIQSIIHSVVCLMTSPWPLPKRVFHTVRSTGLSFNFQLPLISFRSFCSCLPLLPSISPPITCFKRQFLRKM